MRDACAMNVGVVVIGRNEGERLRWCLESAVTRASSIVYVDSGSTDDSVSVARELGVEVVELDPTIPFTAARARNEGIARLREIDDGVEAVQVVDGDCELMPGWLEQATGTMAGADDVAVVCGRRWERYPRLSVYNKLCDMEWDAPIGEARTSGGDALIRLAAFERVGGFNGSVIAGEEPELCLRLRQAGWRVLRVDHDMTVHDAQMTSFGQWWRRAVRCGHAYAEGRSMHRADPGSYRAREVRSALVWGLGLPVVALGAAVPTYGISLVLLAAYALLFRRVRKQRIRSGDVPEDANLYARFCVLAKFPQMLGVLGFTINRRLGRRAGIIEYKGPGKAARTARIEQVAEPESRPKLAGRSTHSVGEDFRVLYVGTSLPGRSQTFVYREVLGLRERGLPVLVASVHEPERRLGDPSVDALAEEAVPVYGTGARRLILDAIKAAIRSPRRGIRTFARGLADALIGGDVALLKRPRVIWQMVAGLALGHRVRTFGIHHVHAHMAHVPTTIAMYAATYLDTPFSFTGHAVGLFSQRTMLRQKLRRAAFVPCISAWHRTFYQRIVRRSDRDLPIVRCGVDVETFAPGPKRRRKKSDPCRLLSVGRLVRKKGFDVLIEALSALSRDDRHFECRIVGDGPEMPALRRQRIEQGVSLGVELLGSRTNEQVRQMMEWADIFVLPCRVDDSGDRDGIPVVLMEAMSCGVPVISGDLVTIRELIEHDTSGLLVRPGSVEDLTAALRTLIDDPAKRQQLTAAAQERIETEFALDLNVQRLHAMFLQMAGIVPDEAPDAETAGPGSRTPEPEQQAA